MSFRKLMMMSSAVAMSLGAGAVRAQEAAEQPSQVEEVIVTAQKRNENLQDVPVAVSAYDDRTRDLLGIVTADDIAKFTPGMEFNLNRAIIRGIGRATSALGTDPGVAIYYDGLYSDNAGSIGGAPMSVERVEILRGPQGTLYGRNSIGGAINVISKRPTDTFEGEFRQKIGSYETVETRLSLSGPLNDRVRYRLEGQYKLRNRGFIENLAGDNRSDSHEIGGQLQLEVDVTDNIELWMQYGNATWPHQRGLLGTLVDPYDTTSFGGALYPNVLRGYAEANPTVNDPFTVSENYPGVIKLVTSPKFVTHLDWDLGATKLKYVGGIYRAKVRIGTDLDFSSRDSFISPITGAFISADTRLRTEATLSSWSHEVNWSSEGEGPFAWIVGAYVGHDSNGGTASFLSPGQPDLENVLDLGTMTIVHNNPDRAYLDSYTLLEGDSRAVYAQGDYQFLPDWTVTAGYRYTWDEKRGYGRARLVYFDPEGRRFLAAFFGPTIGYAIDLGTSTVKTDHEWEGATAKLGLRWEPSAHTMAYASISRGYKAGGFNLGALSTTPIDPEYVNTYEIGVKTRPSDTLQVNSAVFYNDYRDIQVLGSLAGPGGQPTDALFNAERARSYGLETEILWVPTPQWRVMFNYAYLNAEFIDFATGVRDPAAPNGPDGTPATGDEFQDLTGNQMQGAPRNKLAFNALRRFDFSAGSLNLSATYTWTDKQYYSIFNTTTYQGKARDTVDLRATWTDAEGRYDIIGYVQNAFDEVYANNITISSSGGRMWQLGDPRTFGVELQYHF